MVLLDSTAILQAAPCILIQPFSLQFLVYTKIPCMIGTGKTQLIAGMLRELPPAEFISIGINLNYYSTATVLLGSLEAPLQKRTGSTFGPPGSTRLIYFIGAFPTENLIVTSPPPPTRADDLNLP